jgi:hypothetical protein
MADFGHNEKMTEIIQLIEGEEGDKKVSVDRLDTRCSCVASLSKGSSPRILSYLILSDVMLCSGSLRPSNATSTTILDLPVHLCPSQTILVAPRQWLFVEALSWHLFSCLATLTECLNRFQFSSFA